ncbi:hypothetical protein INR49_021855 [Caranx melampygus]|nr:hypothetical protein INR49_021855 [Caranx melampygus]
MASHPSVGSTRQATVLWLNLTVGAVEELGQTSRYSRCSGLTQSAGKQLAGRGLPVYTASSSAHLLRIYLICAPHQQQSKTGLFLHSSPVVVQPQCPAICLPSIQPGHPSIFVFLFESCAK